MGTILVDKRDQLFILNEMLEVNKLTDFPKFSDHSGFDMVLKEAHRFAKNEFYPTIEVGDKEGCVYDPKTRSVKFPECYQKPYKKFREGGWLAMSDSPEVGGDGFPLVIGTAVSEIFYAAGFYIYGAAELSHAAAKVIEKYGTDQQRELYMTRLYSGQWMGTMCLTESDAGSDVGSVQTQAIPNDDGTYSICGTKIYITAGDQDLTENIIHMVLARVPGDPPGTKGLSLFIVPKYRTDETGHITESNDVSCMGIEHKMGLHGLATCTMAYGDNGKCVGYLLGKRGSGIVEMFNMMNEQRLLVGLQGLSYSSAAFLHAVEYAGQRKQGESVYPGDNKKGVPVPIIQHPDIKRMLITMKSHVEAGRALAYFTSYCIDYADITENEEKEKWQGLVELLIPVVKAYLTNKSWEMTGMGIQCAGGYGYCSDLPFERLARDCKVSSIYEGTNGIQAMDLMFRKLVNDNCFKFNQLMKLIDETVQAAGSLEDLKSYANMVNTAKEGLEAVVSQLMNKKESADYLPLYAKAGPFLEAMGDVISGWMHLWQLTIASPKLKSFIEAKSEDEAKAILKKKKEAAFYYGKVCSAQFFIGTLLQNTRGKFEELKSDAAPVIDIFDKSFTG